MQAELHWQQRDDARAITLLETALRQALEERNTEAELISVDRLILLHRERGEYSTIRELAQETIARLSPDSDPDGSWHLALLSHLGDAAFQLGEMPAAAQAYQEAHRIAQEVGDERSAARLLGCMSMVQSELGDLEGSVRTAEAAVQTAQSTGDLKLVGEQQMLLALAYRDADQNDRAVDLCEQAIQVFQELADEDLIEQGQQLLDELEG
jgi:tetratricopeptide (TPR) repeat protein